MQARNFRSAKLMAGRARALLLGLQVLWLPFAAGVEAAELRIVHAFNGDDGAAPGSLSKGPDGTIYGTTRVGGGPDNAGTVFQLKRTVRAAGYAHKVLHAFSSVGGNDPAAGVTPGPGGDLFGITSYGGAGGYGTIFQLVRPDTSGGRWRHRLLRELHTTIGELPIGGIVFDEDGKGYGATTYGGSTFGGTIYQLTPPTEAAAETTRWTFRVFRHLPGDTISDSRSTLVRDTAGNLYGTSLGANSGRVYRIAPGGQVTLLYTFPIGVQPYAGLVVDDDGVLYGVTHNGGSNSAGMVYSLTPPLSGQTRWRFRQLHAFAGPDGSGPIAALIMDAEGTLYGTTRDGGTFNRGTVFELRRPLPDRNRWRHRVLVHLNESTGKSPVGAMVMEPDGTLIGTASLSGPGGGGTVFKVLR